MNDRLILFDVDMTLLSTSGAGRAAMEAAGRELFGGQISFAEIEFAGNLDPVIAREMLTRTGFEPSSDSLAAFETRYAIKLEEHLRHNDSAAALPGVARLLDALDARPGTVLGILSGNYATTGRIKLNAAGLDPDRFVIQVWGDDSPHQPARRTHLPPVAMQRYRRLFGRSIPPSRVVILGDSRQDVLCARENGCRAVGVATGWLTTEGLRAAGADAVLSDLGDTDEAIRALLG